MYNYSHSWQFHKLWQIILCMYKMYNHLYFICQELPGYNILALGKLGLKKHVQYKIDLSVPSLQTQTYLVPCSLSVPSLLTQTYLVPCSLSVPSLQMQTYLVPCSQSVPSLQMQTYLVPCSLSVPSLQTQTYLVPCSLSVPSLQTQTYLVPCSLLLAMQASQYLSIVQLTFCWYKQS